MEKKKAEKKDRYAEAINLHKQKGIDTWIITTEDGKYSCLIRESTPVESAKIFPVLNGMGYDEKGQLKDPDLLEAGKRIVKSGWLAGDDEIRKDENLMAEIALAASTTINLKIGIAKKN